MIRDWTLYPLAVSAICFAWILVVNRRPRLRGLAWPAGVDLGGSLAKPDIAYPHDVVLGCSAAFGTIQCRTLVVASGAEITADVIVALRVRVDGSLQVRSSLTAGRKVVVRGELRAEELRAPKLALRAGSKTTAITVAGKTRIDRHPRAIVKGFFEHRDEIALDDRTRRSPVSTSDDTERVAIVRTRPS